MSTSTTHKKYCSHFLILINEFICTYDRKVSNSSAKGPIVNSKNRPSIQTLNLLPNKRGIRYISRSEHQYSYFLYGIYKMREKMNDRIA